MVVAKGADQRNAVSILANIDGNAVAAQPVASAGIMYIFPNDHMPNTANQNGTRAHRAGRFGGVEHGVLVGVQRVG